MSNREEIARAVNSIITKKIIFATVCVAAAHFLIKGPTGLPEVCGLVLYLLCFDLAEVEGRFKEYVELGTEIDSLKRDLEQIKMGKDD